MAQSHRLPSLLCLIAVAIMAHTVRAQNSPQDFLDAHNTARVSVGVGPMSWDDGVAAYGNKRRADYHLFHSGGTSSRDAVSLWVAEKQYSDYDSNSCVGGKVCGHYTHVVWDDGGVFITCNNSPPGNYVGQRPY